MSPPNRLSPRQMVLLALVVASVIKAGWAIWRRGTCDAMFFYLFAEKLQTHPLEDLYRTDALFNHMPLTGWTIQALFALVGGNYWLFAMLLRFACIAADVTVVVALLRLRENLGGPPWWALALFAASPVSIMVSGFHGNVDPIMTALLFLSAVAAWRERPALCGLLFALACNVKILPILLSPVFFFYWTARGTRPAWRFTLTVCALMLLGTAWPLLRCPADFTRQVLGYGSYWGTWGITYWLKSLGPEALQKMDYKELTPLQNQIMFGLKMVISVSTMVIAWQRRRVAGQGIFATLAMVYTVVFVFAPGVGVQYMVWCAPFLLLCSPGWYAALTAAATLYLAAFYSASSDTSFPWNSVFPKGPEIALWGPWANLTWITFCALLVWMLHRAWRGATPGSAPRPG